MSQIEKNPLGYEKMPSLLKRFAIPSIIAMLVSSLYNIVDQIFIGQCLQEVGNAATTVAFPLSTICLAITLMIAIGSGATFSLRLGSGNKEAAKTTVTNGFWMAVACGIIYAILVEIFASPLLHVFGATKTVMPYAMDYVHIVTIGMPFLILTNVMSNLVRADGKPMYSMVCMVVGAVVNIILDPIFIFTLHLDIKGAAIATVISQIISCILAVRYLKKFRQITVDRTFWKPQISVWPSIGALGMSNCLTQLAITLVQIVMNNLLKYYGAHSLYGSDIPIAAFGIIMKINALFISVFVGFSQSVQPIAGFNYGAQKYDRVKEVYKLAIKYSMLVAVLGFVLFEFFPEQLLSMFGSSDERYMEFGVMAMRIFLFMIVVNGVQIISSNLFSAMGMPLKGILLAMSRQCFFIIPLMFILPIYFGIRGIMFAGPISDTIAFIVSVVMIRREFHIMEMK